MSSFANNKVNAYDLKTGAPLAAPVLNETRTTTTTTGLAQNTGLVAGSRLSTGLVRAEPTVMETIQKDVVVHERIHPIQKEEIQPIIYREREQLDVKQVTQMMHETQIQPTIIQQRELPAERREAIVERGVIAENVVLPTREIDATARSQVVHAPIVNEVIRKTVIEEIQPVLERDIITSTVIQNTQPIYEKIIEAPTVTRETVILGETSGSRRLSQTYAEPLQSRRLSQTYAEPALLNQPILAQQATVQPIVQNRRLSQTYVEPALLNQQAALPTLGLTAPAQNKRLSQTYAEPLLQHNTALLGNQGARPMPGMNGTGIGLASAIPMAQGMNQRYVDPLQNSAFQTNNLASSSGLTGNHGLTTHVTAPGVAGNRLSQGYAQPLGFAQPLAHHNPLDRNMDGKVNLADLAPNAGKLRYAHSDSGYAATAPSTLNTL